MSDLLQHEIKRIRSMTDEKLHARYDKMTKTNKIEAFMEALTQESRAPELRQKIGVGLGYTLFELQQRGTVPYPIQTSTPANDSWVLRSPIGPDEVCFTCHKGPMSIRYLGTGEVHTKNKENARRTWDQLVYEGWRVVS